MKSYSPLRYPGGKGQMYNFILNLLEENNLNNCTYIEPFCGGAGVAIRLLLEGKVQKVILNDFDISIYSFWRAILEQTDEFINLINEVEINLKNWQKYRDVQKNKETYSMEINADILRLGFSTFYLNRTNRSGILKAGVIGGLKQNGEYKMDCRFNKQNLIKLIREISQHKDKIQICNYDAREFIGNFTFEENSFYFIDPPYFKKGKGLYVNFLNHQDHLEIYQTITEKLKNKKWIVTYDVCNEIEEIYAKENKHINELNYSLANKRKEKELLFHNNLNINYG